MLEETGRAQRGSKAAGTRNAVTKAAAATCDGQLAAVGGAGITPLWPTKKRILLLVLTLTLQLLTGPLQLLSATLPQLRHTMLHALSTSLAQHVRFGF